MGGADQLRCAACGGSGLFPRLRVAGGAGAEGLISTTDRYGTALADIVACSVAYYLSRIEGYSRPVGRSLVRGAELARVADSMWAPDFRDRMSVIARAQTPHEPLTGLR